MGVTLRKTASFIMNISRQETTNRTRLSGKNNRHCYSSAFNFSVNVLYEFSALNVKKSEMKPLKAYILKVHYVREIWYCIYKINETFIYRCITFLRFTLGSDYLLQFFFRREQFLDTRNDSAFRRA